MIAAWHREPVGSIIVASYALGAGDPPGAVQLIASGAGNRKNRGLPIFDASSPRNSAHTCRANAKVRGDSREDGEEIAGFGEYAKVELETRGEDEDELWARFDWFTQGNSLIRGGHRYLIVSYYGDPISSILSLGLSRTVAPKPKPRREVPLSSSPAPLALRDDDWRNPATNLSRFDVESGTLFRAGA